MNPTLVVWLEVTGIIALEVAVMAGIAALLQRVIKQAAWHRVIWQASLLAMVVLLSMEFAGVARPSMWWLKYSPLPIVPHQSPAFQFVTLPDGFQKAEQIRQRVQTNAAGGSPVVHSPSEFRRAPVAGTAHFTPPAAPVPLAPIQVSGLHNAEDIRSQIVAKAISLQPLVHTPSGAPIIPVPPLRLLVPKKPDMRPVLVFLLVWMIGTAFVLGRMLVGRAVFQFLRRKWRRIENPKLEQRVRALADNLGMRRKVRLIESGYFAGPVAFGVVRPTIGLPKDFALRFTEAQQSAMLLHELAHLSAHDPAWRLVADVATGLLWWHPLVWWARRKLQAATETAADEASLLMANGPAILAECLVLSGALLTARVPFGSLGMAGTGFRSGLGRRVERLVELGGGTWSPPGAKRFALVKLAGTVVLVLAAILCTAWAVPAGLTKGENMQTMQHTWKRSLAAFALLATLGTEQQPVLATDAGIQASPKPGAAGVEEPATVSTAPATQPVGGVPGGGTLPTPVAETQSAPTVTGSVAGVPFGVTYGQTTRIGAGGFPGQTGNGFLAGISGIGGGDRLNKEQQLVHDKLERTRIDTVSFNGLPLGEVVRFLVDYTSKHEPEKNPFGGSANAGGINFVINREQAAPISTPGTVDPTTGLPIAPMEAVDLNSVTIMLDPPLKNVRLIDVLDAITKVADHPIKYSIEDYGVVFSLDSGRMSPAAPFVASEPLVVRTFKVDTNTFFAGLESAFGIKVPDAGKRQPQEVQEALRQLLQQLGINVNAQNRSIFYNQLTGILMVRSTVSDLDVVQAAIETLGGGLFSSQSAAASTSFGVGTLPGAR